MSETNEQSTDDSSTTASQEDFATLFAASEKQTKRQQISMGDLVSGTVIAIGQSSAFIAIGGKGEATIDPNEFRDPATGEIKLAVGDKVEATVVDDGSRSGGVVLKRIMGRGSNQAAVELEQAMANRVAVEGVVTAEIKGGFEVQVGSLRAFCPGSQIDRRRGGDRIPGSSYIGQRLQFRVTKVEYNGRNVVVSRRELLDEQAAEEAAKTWAKIQPGATLDGTVTSVRDFGAFVDLGGVEGMVHISELGYGRVKHPSDVVSPGQQVQVQVLKVDEAPDSRGRRQIALSLKALANDPWSSVAEHFPVGATVSGVVRRLEGFGAFVEVAPGVEGLVHISKITLDRRLAHARQALEVGQAVETTVLGIDASQRRMSLSLVEQVKTARDAAVVAERQEEQAAMAQNNLQQRSFGNFAELLAASRKK